MKPVEFHQDLHVTVKRANGFVSGGYLRNYESIGGKLRYLREHKKDFVSQAELAKRLSTTQSAVSRVEDGQHDNLTLATLRKYAEVLGYSVEIIFTETAK